MKLDSVLAWINVSIGSRVAEIRLKATRPPANGSWVEKSNIRVAAILGAGIKPVDSAATVNDGFKRPPSPDCGLAFIVELIFRT